MNAGADFLGSFSRRGPLTWLQTDISTSTTQIGSGIPICLARNKSFATLGNKRQKCQAKGSIKSLGLPAPGVIRTSQMQPRALDYQKLGLLSSSSQKYQNLGKKVLRKKTRFAEN